MKVLMQHFLLISLIFVMVGCGIQNEESNYQSYTHTGIENLQQVKKESFTAEQFETSSNENNEEKEKEIVEEEAKDQEKKEETDKQIEIQTDTIDEDLYVAIDALNVRKGNDTSYDVIGQVSLNDTISATGKTENGWYQFNYNDNKAFISGSYLSNEKIDPQANSSSEESEETSGTKETSNESNSNENSEPKNQEKQNSEAETTPLIAQTSTAQSTDQIVTVVHTGGGNAKIEYWKRQGDNWNNELTTNGFVGSNGVSPNKVEGDRMTPTGTYSFGTAFGTSNPGSKMNFKTITQNSYWISNIEDPDYNTWQERESSSSKDEHLMNYPHQYKYGLTVNYNTQQEKGKGSAIFLHVSNGSPTLGCVSVPENHMTYFLNELGNNARIIIAGSQEQLLNY